MILNTQDLPSIAQQVAMHHDDVLENPYSVASCFTTDVAQGQATFDKTQQVNEPPKLVSVQVCFKILILIIMRKEEKINNIIFLFSNVVYT